MSVRKDKHSPVTEGFHTDEQSSYPVSIAGSVLVFSPSLLMLLIKDFCEMFVIRMDLNLKSCRD
jgi:hypothetical protein